ncbi:MAG: hypothetical protein ABSG97_04135 [Sedimentisphaerales bacterium]|jgi:hypothetical protein
MRQSDLWGPDYGITDVAHRADYGGYKPFAACGFGLRERGFQI